MDLTVINKKVFIAHQIAGDIKSNLESAKRWCRWAILMRGVNPVAPYLLLTQLLDDKRDDERELGVSLGDDFIVTCSELWMCGPIPRSDSHVWAEVEIARQKHIHVIDYTGLTLPDEFH